MTGGDADWICTENGGLASGVEKFVEELSPKEFSLRREPWVSEYPSPPVPSVAAATGRGVPKAG
jgi:hypothetical protein